MAYIGNEVTQSKFVSVAYTATADQTTFPSSGALPETAANAASVIVTVNGLVSQTNSFTISTTLVFSAGLNVGDYVEIIWLGLAGSVTTVGDNTVTNAKIARAGTSGQLLTSAGTGADVTWSTYSPHKTITKTDSYTITAADCADVPHLFCYVDSTGATDPLIITLPDEADWPNQFITVWVETYNKEVKVHRPITGTSMWVATFRAADDLVTMASRGAGLAFVYVLDFTSGGAPP
jgi:hypothetical protein|tara:strand:+ start:721 stop:1425 length:705 start_codon:yes stop_codon:yes gene_type:complete